MTQLPAGIMRAKGVLYLQDAPGQRFVLQLVGKRWSLKAADDWGEHSCQSQLVMIGVPGSIDADRYQQTLQ